jgi:predicted flap endonuclease-1-like 5' DNA nuclease
VPPNDATVQQYEGEEPGSSYRWVALVAGLAAIAVAAVAALGLVAPGALTAQQLALAGAAATIVLGLTVATAFALVDRGFVRMRRQRDAIEAQQDAIRSAREEAWERHEEIERRGYDERIDELQARLEAIDAELASLTQRTRWSADASPFGDIHETDVVTGIHQDERRQLAELGIDDTEQLWMANPKRVAGRLDRDTRTVRRWQQRAELLALPHVGSRSAEILTEAGVRSIPELAAWDPLDLVEHLDRRRGAIDSEPEEGLVSPSRAEVWVDNARRHDPTAYRVHRHRSRSPSSAEASP